MKNSKILISFLLVLLVAISMSAVCAEDNATATATTYNVTGTDDVAIQDAINNATAGDTIDLGSDKTYTINSTVTLDKEINIVGTNVVFNGEGQSKGVSGASLYDGFINVLKEASNSKITGISFVNVDADGKYTGVSKVTLNGYGIQIANGATGVVIDNCKFTDFNNGVYISNSPSNIIQNCWFTGNATFINNIPSGPKDRGAYAISIMRSKGNVVQNNTFYGPLCDGVSIAGGSGSTIVKGNTFDGNAYSIYFGGASTGGSVIEDNIFINCGSFSTSYDDNGTTKNVSFNTLPVISVQKASDDFVIQNNKFTANSYNILIGANEANTAHGYPSNIGNILVTGNTVTAAEGADISTVVLFNIISESGILNPIGPINISANTLNGAKAAAYWSYDWGTDQSGDVYIAAADPAKTFFEIQSVEANAVVATLKDVNGKVLAGQSIAYTMGTTNGTIETDENGTCTIANPNGLVTLDFAGSATLAAASAAVTYTPPVVPTLKATKLTTPTKTYKVKATKKLTITLKSGSAVVKGKIVTVKVNGKTYYATTNAKGQATVTVKLTKAKTYKYTAKFAGDATYKAVSKTGTIKVKK
ncbi:MAG: right-handed parallel beta-helix repeat-containing protein [Methanobrevibacter sp.]|nr:right-handed parallel beta-helix repeat-containing protein [Methanobrevibacter sp.]